VASFRPNSVRPIESGGLSRLNQPETIAAVSARIGPPTAAPASISLHLGAMAGAGDLRLVVEGSGSRFMPTGAPESNLINTAHILSRID
jgi:hypothetical protein